MGGGDDRSGSFPSHGTTLCRFPKILFSHYWVKLDWHLSLKVRPLIPDLPRLLPPIHFFVLC